MRNRYGFTLIETLTVTAIVAVLSAVLFPTFTATKRSALQTRDLANVRQIGMGVAMYAGDHDDRVPPCRENLLNPGETTWVGAVQPYVKSKLLIRSPFDDSPAWGDATNPRLTSYALNAYFDNGHPPYHGMPLGSAQRPSDCVLSMPLRVYLTHSQQLVRGDHFMPQYFGTPAKVLDDKFQDLQWDAATRRPRMIDVEQCFGRANTLYADGHAKATRFERLWVQTPGVEPYVDLFDPLRAD